MVIVIFERATKSPVNVKIIQAEDVGDDAWYVRQKEIKQEKIDAAARLAQQRAEQRANDNKQHSGVSTFETTIRALGGLVSAYELSGEKILLEKARSLGDGLLGAFNTKTKVAMPHTNFFRGGGGGGMQTTIAEAGTLQVEFGSLAKNTREEKYYVAEKFFDVIQGKSRDGMYPMSMNVASGSLNGVVSWGASGDSAYEYFLKYYLYNPRGGKKDTRLLEMYNKAVEGMKKSLIKKSAGGLTYLTDSGSANGRGGKMEHLACFVPGLLALGALHNPTSPTAQEDLDLAEKLAETCYEMYARTETGLAAEGVYFFESGSPGPGGNADFRPISSMRWNILRPETLESLFVLYQVTGDVKYREWSWNIWQAFDNHCKSKYGYGAHPDVFTASRKCCQGNDDKQETFWIAETIKYAYITQAQDFSGIDLTKYVLNTEAHPMKIG
ncbi:hypothetical protein TrST_g10331 [Triparma strigata]|uniref:alpha-1,2-Mannosidase n=1 Tax=Triparma strigata TaxID=1606541 RepID=A0A9W7EK38_9STRA|nr:hypothetical protein TrST_g10331 [Triparma strigata]